MKVPKPSDRDKELFRALVPEDPAVEVKPMFGNLGAFVNGNMFMGLFGGDVGVKLSKPDLQALAKEEGSGPFGPEERPMGGYLTLPPEWRTRPEAVTHWVERALQYVGSLPPKVKSKKGGPSAKA